MTIIPDLTTASPGDPPPVRVGTAWCSTPEGMPRAIPVYAAWPGGVEVSGGVVTDLEDGWTVDRVQMDTPPVPSADERLDAARAALVSLDTIEAPVLTTEVVEALTAVRTALEA